MKNKAEVKEIQLTQGKVALVDDADYEWLNQWKWYAKKERGTFYAVRGINKGGDRRSIRMHRLILGLTDPKDFGDHKDMDGLNNQRNNLRKCSHAQNQRNRNGHRNSASKFKGVTFRTKDNMWYAQIKYNKKLTHLGGFKTEIEAAQKYNEAATKYHGEFARLNIIS